MGTKARPIHRLISFPTKRSTKELTCFSKEPCLQDMSMYEPPSFTNRRNFFKCLSFLSSTILSPSICWAGKSVGESITEVVTESDLGVTVRRSVVRGAQIFDQVDKKWEQFSYTFHLGAQRSQTVDRPKPKVVPPRRSLNSILADRILSYSDEVGRIT